MALDHPWLDKHPDYFIRGNEELLAREPKNYFRHTDGKIFAYGRDPNFSGWPDTAQLNYANPALQEAMMNELLRISDQCDGLRCDMAMLILPDVFERTWGLQAPLFWPEAAKRIRSKHPDFVLMAEVYWDLEWTLQQQGFDYTYDKRLYDRLRDGQATPVRDHLRAERAYQKKMARFLENHDESRAAATFISRMHEAAAVITALSPGLRFFHQGQFNGRRKRISPHLARAPRETNDVPLQQFYERLLSILKLPVLRSDEWQLIDCVPVWHDNSSHSSYIAFSWGSEKTDRLLVVVNYSGAYAQCFVKIPFADLGDRHWKLKDLMSDVVLNRDGNELTQKGLFMDEGPWKYYVFSLTTPGKIG